jgi:hypothetical protein
MKNIEKKTPASDIGLKRASIVKVNVAKRQLAMENRLRRLTLE